MKSRTSLKLPNTILNLLISITLAAIITGCASTEKKSEFLIKTYQLTSDPTKPKSIFVFLDGTANDPKSKTNVWKLYDSLSSLRDIHATGIYIEGVGNRDEQPILGMALGKGMEERVLRGYEFIVQNYNHGDDIYIFGFSRGAHEARDLAGFLAYAGIPIVPEKDRGRLMKIGNNILELVKEKSDADYLDKWKTWGPNQSPLLADEIKDKLKLEMRTAEIKFLGIWDTVPGSSFKKFGVCKEEDGIKKGDRYKSGSYPAIRQIVHAVSLDEKRSKFAPLLLCPPIKSEATSINEAWFPGAHADIGGGYEDSNELSGITYNWMLDLLAKQYSFATSLTKINENAKGLAHWSIGDPPANIGSACEDRTPPQGAQIHPSFNERKASSLVPVRVSNKVQALPYPLDCNYNKMAKT